MISDALRAAVKAITDPADIYELWDIAKDQLHYLSRVRANQFRPGERVKFTGRRGRTLTGEIVDVRVSKVKVRVMEGGMPRIWIVPASMLTYE